MSRVWFTSFVEKVLKKNEGVEISLIGSVMNGFSFTELHSGHMTLTTQTHELCDHDKG